MHTKPVTNIAPNGSRSRNMIQCLRDSLLYSEKRPRDLLFRAAEEIVQASATAGDGVMLARLTLEMEALGRAWCVAEGFEANNWAMQARAVVNTMVRAGVLLDEQGQSVRDGIGANAAIVCGLSPGFQERSEAFLVHFLIRKLGDVSTRDHKAIAHALLRRFDPNIPIADLEDYIVVLISRLEGFVSLTEAGLYCSTVEPPAPAA